MYVVAITGGIGAGKSAATSLLVEKGAAAFDLDQVSREVSVPGTEVFDRLVDRFGDEVVADDGTLNRAALAEVAFSDPKSVADLDAIVHPAIIERMLTEIAAFRAEGDSAPRVLVIEVPLLHLYPDLRSEFDEILAVATSLCVREERAKERGMTPWDFEARNLAQPGDSARAAISDTVFDNDGDRAALEAQVDAWWRERVHSGWVSPRGMR